MYVYHNSQFIFNKAYKFCLYIYIITYLHFFIYLFIVLINN